MYNVGNSRCGVVVIIQLSLHSDFESFFHILLTASWRTAMAKGSVMLPAEKKA